MWELAVLFVIWLVVAPILGVIAFFRKRDDGSLDQTEVSALRNSVQVLTNRVDRLERDARRDSESLPAQNETPSAPITTTGPQTVSGDTLETPQDDGPVKEEAASEYTDPVGERAAATESAAPQPSSTQREAMFASRWLVWLGGIIFAIGGAFLVSYSVEAGLLGPAQRIGAAILLGMASVVAGEYVRFRPLSRVAVALNANTIPAVLTAAGIAIVFAAVYGGYELYGFFGAFPTFIFLLLTAMFAVALSLLHDRYGSYIAALGLLGAYVVPMLVQTGDPNVTVLFLYVGILNLAALSLLRWRQWSWLTWGVFVGAIIWPLLFEARVDVGVLEIQILGLYAIISAGLGAVILVYGRPTTEIDLTDPKTFSSSDVGSGFWVSMFGAVAAALFLIRFVGSVEPVSIAALNVVICAAVFIGLASWLRQLFLMALISVGMLVALVVLWPLGSDTVVNLQVSAWKHVASTEGPLFPAGTLALIQMALAAMAGAFLVGMYKLWRERPGYWASIAMVTPLSVFLLLYLRMNELPHSFAWNYAAIGLALIFELAAFRIWRFRQEGGLDPALAAFIIGITASVSLSIAMTLEHAWLTVALAVQVPVLAAIYRRLKITILTQIAAVVAGIVVVRLLLNPDVASYPIPGDGALWNWIWYGYGIPALSFAVAARWLGGDNRAPNAMAVIQAAAISLFVVMVTLEIRVFAHDKIWTFAGYSLYESALHVIAWGSMGVALYAFGAKASPVISFARRWLIRYAGIHVLLVHLIILNPLWNVVEVGRWPLLNVLGLAYLMPAMGAAVISYFSYYRPKVDRLVPLPWSLGATAVLAFAYVNFEVRALFHGGVLGPGAVTQAELYTYSGAWFVMAAGLLAVGIWREVRQLRLAGLALLALVVGKVFLVDMSQLEGIFRVMSFIGLGIGLVVIGFAYQRFVLPSNGVLSQAKGGIDR